MAYRTVSLAVLLSLSTLACSSDDPASDPEAESGTEGEPTTSPEDEDEETDGSSSTGEPESDIPGPSDTVDYAVCDNGLDDLECEGLACADDDTHGAASLLLEVAEDRGLAHVFSLSGARTLPDTDQLFLNFQVQVDWFRTRDTISLRLPLTDDELRAEFEAHLDQLEFPTAVAPFESVQASVQACFGLVFDPCSDNWPDFRVHVQRDGADECDEVTATVIDVETGEVLSCGMEPVACG